MRDSRSQPLTSAPPIAYNETMIEPHEHDEWAAVRAILELFPDATMSTGEDNATLIVDTPNRRFKINSVCEARR